LIMSIFLLPTLYVWVSRDGDKLPEPEMSFDEGA
jgi:heavy metal efflux system protein